MAKKNTKRETFKTWEWKHFRMATIERDKSRLGILTREFERALDLLEDGRCPPGLFSRIAGRLREIGQEDYAVVVFAARSPLPPHRALVPIDVYGC